MSDKKDVRQYLQRLERAGFGICRSRSNHLKVYWGREMAASAACTPSGGRRSFANFKGEVNR